MFRNSILLLLVIAFLQVANAWRGFDRGGNIEDSMHLTPDIENGERIYQICVFCHTKNGWGVLPGIGNNKVAGAYPQLAGQHTSVIIKQILDIRNRNRDNPSMYPFTLEKYLGGNQQIADVAAYIAKMPINHNNSHGDGNDLEHGKLLYDEHCAECHKEDGSGDDENFYPRLSNQHYNYMLRQFIWIRDGKRRNANKKMISQIQDFNYRDIRAVIDYASRLNSKE